MVNLLFPELSYQLIGVLFEVHRELGSRYQEKYYQRAVEQGLKSLGVRYQKEISVDLVFKDKKIGKYFLDFLVENKIVLELKAEPIFLPSDYRQVRAYLKACGLELGILANFRSEQLVYGRILNRVWV